MKATRFTVFFFLFTIIYHANMAQQDDLSASNDEFNDSSTLKNWSRQDIVEQYPSRLKKVDINTTSKGHLYLEPYACTWFENFQGAYLSKIVSGDFDVRVR